MVKHPLSILQFTVTGNPFVVVALTDGGINGWRIVSECCSLESARRDARTPGSRVYQRSGETFKRISKR